MNNVSLIGRLGKDFEVKEFGEGNIVAKGFMAVDDYNSKKKEKETSWIPLVAFGKTADGLCANFKKGSRIGITGRLKTNSYEKDGQKRTSFDIVVNSWVFIDKKEEK